MVCIDSFLSPILPHGCSKNLSMIAEKAPNVKQPAQAAFGPALAASVPPAKQPAYMEL